MIKDRLDIVRKLEKIAEMGPVLQQAFTAKPIALYSPSANDHRNTGLYGTQLQNLVGPSYDGSVPDYLLAELKSFDAASNSAVTIGTVDFADFSRTYEDSHLLQKAARMVFAELTKQGKFSGRGIVLDDKVISRIFTVDVTTGEIGRLFKADFEGYAKAFNERYANGWYSGKLLYIDVKTKGQEQWRIRNSKLAALVNQDELDAHRLFDR